MHYARGNGGHALCHAGQDLSLIHIWLEEILPRSSQCLRPPVANITLLVIVAAVAPAPDWLLIDKLLLGARMQSMRAVLVMNKCDLGEEAAQQARRDYAGAELPVLCVLSLIHI